MTAGALSGVDIWDGEHLLGTGAVAWADGVLGEISIARGTAARGLSVIPGLVDTHVHLDVAVGEQPADSGWALATGDADKAMHVAGGALRFARNGVTTLRDLYSTEPQFAAARALASGVVPGPRLLAYGPVSMTAGHGDLFTPRGAAARPPVADGVDACRRLVREWVRAGADGIKIYTSGGILSLGDEVGWRNHTFEETAAIVDEAHALGRRVAAHALSAEGVDVAIRAGADSVEHATGLTAGQIDALAAAGVPVAPTLAVHERILAGDDPLLAAARRQTRAVVAQRDAVFAEAARRGVRFVLGTDANGRLVPYTGAHAELRRMRDVLGWSAERTLVAGTSDAAASLGLGGAVGRIARGYSADLLLVRGRPWEDLDALDPSRIIAVVAQGRLLHGTLPTP
ncbi:amidohydrolase family protein [Microbacterium sp. NPDC055683]